MAKLFIIALVIILLIMQETQAGAVLALAGAIALELAIEQGINAIYDARETVPNDDCIFIFTTKEIDGGEADIYIHTKDGDTEKTTESFSGGWDSPDTNTEDIDGNYNIDSIEIYFSGKFQLASVGITCGKDINVGGKTLQINHEHISYLMTRRWREYGTKQPIPFTPGDSYYIKHMTLWRAAFYCNHGSDNDDFECMDDAVAIYTDIGQKTPGYDCPSGYKGCGDESGQCLIPQTVQEGYISYGASGRYTLIPFTNKNSDGNDMEVDCDNTYGDIRAGYRKSCCYKSEDTGIFVDHFDGDVAEDHDGDQGFYRSELVIRYGAEDQYVYRLMDDTVVYCNNDFFNDPIRGTRKHCQWNAHKPDKVGPLWDYRKCSNEGEWCDDLDKTTPQWVKYATDRTGIGYYKLVIAKQGKIPCTNKFFGDPKKGTKKYCYAIPSYLRGSTVGSWNAVNLFSGTVPWVFILYGLDALLFTICVAMTAMCYCSRQNVKNTVYYASDVDSGDGLESKPINM